jgi:hypothetical protein
VQLWFVLLLVTVLTSCVYGPPLYGRETPPDNAPFYFPSGLVPSPFNDVIVDLGAGDTRTFGLQVFDRDRDEELEYEWTLLSPALDVEAVLGSGLLTDPSAINDVYAWQVPRISFQTCQGTVAGFLSEEGDEITFELTIRDEIPEEQRFDDSASFYEIIIRWNVVALGNCNE